MSSEWTADRIVEQTIRIMSQGVTAMQRLTDAYFAKRTQEADVNWVTIQMAREYGAMNFYGDLARLAIRGGISGRDADEFTHIIKEEVDHYRSYQILLDLTIGKDTPMPDDDCFHYLNIRFAPDGVAFFPGSEEVVARKWPEHHRFISLWMDNYNNLPSWSSKLLMTQGEGGSCGWHWCLANAPQTDDFLKGTAKLEKVVVEDELHHGPDEIRRLAEAYDPANAMPMDEMFEIAREMRYLDIRERNEQFLHPLSEAELEEIRELIFSDALEPATIYDEVA